MTIEYPIITQAADGSITRALPPRTPTSHPHGGITNAGTIGTTADLILGTGTAGAIETRTASQVRTLLGLATTDDVVLQSLTLSRYVTVGTTTTGAAAGSIYRVSDTLRYRDSTNTERLLLNATDNLANLANAATARTNLGLGSGNSPEFAQVVIGGSGSATAPLLFFNGAGTGNQIGFYRSSFDLVAAAQGVPVLRVSYGFGTVINRDSFFGWTNDQFNALATSDLRIYRDAANTFHQRNGTNGQIARWAKTWTSATNNEVFELDCAGNATTFDFAVCSGLAGGSNRGLRIGSKFAGGAFSSWLSFDTAGLATFSSAVLATAFTPISANARLDTNGINCGSATTFGISSATNPNAAARDVQLGRNATGPAWSARADGGVEVRNLANTAFAPLSCSDLTLVPSASRTLSTNGQFTIEMTSNTAGNLVYRGSDGTTRRMALTFT